MQNLSPKIELSQDYQTYVKNVEGFNNSINVTIADIYSKLNVIAQSINELDKAKQNNVDPAYVSRLDTKVGKLASDLNSVIS